ncbi:MAG: GNAT family N-acetyltransferase [Thermoguttaceae bacterium]|nr:GNAT family N-acetyltransferase [Thermoguttaceae bacterium]MDW8037579.1 GNAT family N-acetyltransferase [Thermoguttaceae bacterium]
MNQLVGPSHPEKTLLAPYYTPYYAQFRGQTFIIQAEDEAVETTLSMRSVLEGIQDLLRHGIRVVLVFGKPARFLQELQTQYGARRHPETNRLLIPENALDRLVEERGRIGQALASLSETLGMAATLLPASVVRAERRIGHQSTGVVTGLELGAIQQVLDRGELAILGFGGQTERGEFLHIPSVGLAADLAVALQAQKLLLLAQTDGIWLPHRRGGQQQLSFADLEELLCLLTRQRPDGSPLVAPELVPKVHAAIRAVAGGVPQVHIVSYSRLLEEVLTRTGVGTMIERLQSHYVEYARPEDLDEIHRLHTEALRYTTARGTPFVKPLDREELERLLPWTLLLTHRGVLIGKLHGQQVPGVPGALCIGGFVVGEDHQDSQQGQLLLSEALERFRQRGYQQLVAITASPRAKRAFERVGGQVPEKLTHWQQDLLTEAQKRYHPQERDEVQLYSF